MCMPDHDMEKWEVRLTTVTVTEEGQLQVRKQGSVVNITLAFHTTITGVTDGA